MNTATDESTPNKKNKKNNKIKKDIEEYVGFFGDNVQRYKRSMRFAFKETLDDRDRRVLDEMDKPVLEVNYVQPYLSRLLGERAQQSPDVTVSGNGTGNEININTVDVVEGHMRNILDAFHKSGQSKQVSKEQCGGGYSVLKVSTEYRNDETFVQDIVLSKAGDPVMCFFDPMAKLSSKSDGKICGEFIPMTKKDAKEKYPKCVNIIDEMSFNVQSSNDNSATISWSYKNGTKDMVLLADTFVVESEKRKLVLLSDDKVMPVSEYNKMVKEWDDIGPPPSVVKHRTIDDEKIKRYVMLGEYILDEESTSLPGLPYIFVDGDSASVYKTDTGGEVEQVVRSYIHNAIDAQKLLNYTCQAVANYSENYMQQRFAIDERGIVDESQWENPQRAAVLITRSIDDKDREVPPIKEIVQQDLAPSIMSTWHGMQNVMQNTFGSYDAQLGISGNALSGESVTRSATQSSAVSAPFKDGLMDALNSVSALILKMIPLYYVTPMTIPHTDKEGEKNFIKINGRLPDGTNDPGALRLDYEKNDLDVNVAAGYSFALQKDKALKMLGDLSKAFPALAEEINEHGLAIIAENLEIHSRDKLIQLIKERQERQKSAANQPKQPNPIEQQMMLKQKELALKEEQMRLDMEIKTRELEIRKEESENQVLMEKIKLQRDVANDIMRRETHEIDNAATISEQMIKKVDQEHRHAIDLMKAHR